MLSIWAWLIKNEKFIDFFYLLLLSYISNFLSLTFLFFHFYHPIESLFYFISNLYFIFILELF